MGIHSNLAAVGTTTGMIAFPGLRPAAGQADSSRSRLAVYSAGVLWRELVSVVAMGLARMARRGAYAAQDVDPMRYGLKVGRVLAGAVSAQVVYLESLWYRAVGKNPCGAVCSKGFACPNAEDAISVAIDVCGPQPTFIGAADIHLFPEPHGKWLANLETRVMSGDKSPWLALDVSVPGVILAGQRRLLSAAAPTEAVAMGPIVGGNATIGVKHRNLISGEPLGVCGAARGNLYAPNYSTFTLLGAV